MIVIIIKRLAPRTAVLTRNNVRSPWTKFGAFTARLGGVALLERSRWEVVQ